MPVTFYGYLVEVLWEAAQRYLDGRGGSVKKWLDSFFFGGESAKYR